MSRAGTKSSQGDDFQIAVVIHWIIRLLFDDTIDYIQAESNGIREFSEKVTVDDVVVVYQDNHRRYIQAKKNQSQNRAWSLADLGDELIKSKEQLCSDNMGLVDFYSATPFGDFESLATACREYPDLVAFQREVGKKQNDVLADLAERWKESVDDTYRLIQRIGFGSHHTYDEWKRQNLQELGRLVTQPNTALAILESFTTDHQSKQSGSSFEITKKQILTKLREHGVVAAPNYAEQELLNKFADISRIGRDWKRTVGNQQITRPEFANVIQNIEQQKETILIVDRPGSGKTCLLLDIAEHVENDNGKALLFLKGDRFVDAESRKHLPDDLIEMCARFAESKPLVIVIDSLDVLSLNRDSGSLSYFLNLIDRLNGLTNIILVVACRNFDLQYDAKLRNRKWKQKIELADFDFDEIVAPLLAEWGVNSSSLTVELQQLLCLPQNLRLFESIANLDCGREIHNAYELQNVFLEECVRKHPDIGTLGLRSLEQLAHQLLTLRTHHISVAQFSTEESIRRSLISQNILFEDAGKIAFTHQTLFDILVVQHALANNKDLLSFIQAYPPFPFLRASVQTFVFYLRTHNPELFSRQITKVLASDDVAYHLKRLIVETIGTLNVDLSYDWFLVRRIFQQHPSLFERMFWKTTGDGWFKLLLEKWLPLLSDEEEKWRGNFLRRLGQWANEFPDEVTELRIQAINDNWRGVITLDAIIYQLDDFTKWNNEKTYLLIELIGQKLASEPDSDKFNHFLNILSWYVAATDKGYGLLWGYMTRNVSGEGISRLELGNQLDCDFRNKNFLQQALNNSEYFLNLVLKDLAVWAHREELRNDRQLNTAFIYSCPSYNRRHNRQDLYHVENLGRLTDSIEKAIDHHARGNTEWWQKNEPKLKISSLLIFQYFLIKPYSESPENYTDGISTLLTNFELLRDGHLEYELGQLMQAAYYLVPEAVQIKNQHIILNLYKDDDWSEQYGYSEELPLWVYRKQYNYLLWIPLIFRSSESQIFVEQYAHDFGNFLPEPDISMSGGYVGYPLTLNELLSLSDNALVTYCRHYEGYNDGFGSHPGDHLRGDQDMLKRRLSEAASYEPSRYLKLVPLFISSGLDVGYAQSIAYGVAQHLRYRYGNLTPSNREFNRVQPEVDGELLAKQLLNLMEEEWLWIETREFNLFSISEACCEVLTDKEQTERLVFLLFQFLFKLRKTQASYNRSEASESDLRVDAINSDWGHIGGGIAKLCNRLLAAEHETPELIFSLLRHLIKTSSQAAIMIIDHIPYLTHKKPEWGFKLFSDIYDTEVPACPWGWAQQHLYYQYHNNFKYTAPYLEKMLKSGESEALQGWGALSTMCHLSGHLTQNQLFQQLIEVNKEEAWIAATQVFEANIDKHTHDRLCISGMTRILELELGLPQVISEIEDAFDPEKHGAYLDNNFAKLYIEKASFNEDRWSIKHLLDWLANLSSRDPLASLELLEMLADKLSADSARRLYDGKSLIQALNALLREADETDDSQLIKRVIDLQDRFLQLDLYGIEEFFNAAGKS